MTKNVPELPSFCGSWVIVLRGTISAVCEMFSREAVERVDFDKYEALPAIDYLVRLNAKIKERCGADR